MRFSVLGFRSDIRIELQAPVVTSYHVNLILLFHCDDPWLYRVFSSYRGFLTIAVYHMTSRLGVK